MQRVSVVGISGSGKSTLAAALGPLLTAPVVELDGVYHQADWTPLDTDAFQAAVRAAVSADRWVVDGNYPQVRDLVWARADTVVWLALPRRTVLRRVVGRTLRRLLTRRSLWNGNRERWRTALAWDPERSVIRWAWTQHPVLSARYQALLPALAATGVRVVTLHSASEVRAFLTALTTAAGSGSTARSAGRAGGASR